MWDNNSPYNAMSGWGQGPLTNLQNPDQPDIRTILDSLGQWGQQAQDNVQIPMANPLVPNPNNQSGNGGNGWWNGMSGVQKGQFGLQAGSSLLNAFMGLKQYNLARDQFKFQKNAFNINHNNQVKTTNASLKDRQAARVAANPGGNVMSVDDYMAKNKVS